MFGKSGIGSTKGNTCSKVPENPNNKYGCVVTAILVLKSSKRNCHFISLILAYFLENSYISYLIHYTDVKLNYLKDQSCHP